MLAHFTRSHNEMLIEGPRVQVAAPIPFMYTEGYKKTVLIVNGQDIYK